MTKCQGLAQLPEEAGETRPSAMLVVQEGDVRVKMDEDGREEWEEAAAVV